jgi:cytochrome c
MIRTSSSRQFFLFLLAAVLCFATAAGIFGQASHPSTGAGQAASASGSPLEVAEGKAIYDQRCAVCHFSNSTAKKIGPGLKGLYARRKFADGRKVDDASVTAWIEIGGKDMPGFKDALKPAQVRELMAYLKTL